MTRFLGDHRLGFGTIWFGRPWPPQNHDYKPPVPAEVDRFLDGVYAALPTGRIMLDTATAYGTSEDVVGGYLARHPAHAARTVVATKWGGSWERECAGCAAFVPTVAQLETDVAASIARLGRPLDILYAHLPRSVPAVAALACLRDGAIHEAYARLRASGQVHHVGASISDAAVLMTALEEGLLTGLDVVQVPAAMLAEHPALAAQLFAQPGVAVVVNSPVRSTTSGGASTDDALAAYRAAFALHPRVVVLTGTRSHLQETLDAYRHELA